MEQDNSIRRLELLFNNKMQFEHEILTCSSALLPNASIDDEFKSIKNTLQTVASSKEIDSKIVKKYNLLISIKIFQKRVSNLHKSIEDYIFKKMDVFADRNQKVEYLSEQLGNLYDISQKIFKILNSYPETKEDKFSNSDLATIEKILLPPPTSILVIEDFIQWALAFVEKIKEIDENEVFALISKMDDTEILGNCLSQSYVNLRFLSGSIINNHRNLLKEYSIKYKENDFVSGIVIPVLKLSQKKNDRKPKERAPNKSATFAEEYLYFMKSRNPKNNNLIMDETQYTRMIQYTNYYFAKNALPKKIKALSKLNINNGDIVHTFKKMYDVKYPKPPRSFEFFKFLNEVFSQLHVDDFCKENYQNKSTFKKWASEPTDYQRLIKG